MPAFPMAGNKVSVAMRTPLDLGMRELARLECRLRLGSHAPPNNIVPHFARALPSAQAAALVRFSKCCSVEEGAQDRLLIRLLAVS